MSEFAPPPRIGTVDREGRVQIQQGELDSLAKWLEENNKFRTSALATTSFNGLDDVTVTSVADNDIAGYDSTSGVWINQSSTELGLSLSTELDTTNTNLNNHIANLSAHTDVTVTSVADNEVLAYDSTSSKWINQTAAEAGLVPTVSGISDVTITSVADNEVLAYDNGSSTWINQTASEASLAATSDLGQFGSINTQTDSYTLVLADKGKAVEMNKGSSNNLTVPPNSSVAFPPGTKIAAVQLGSGTTTIVAGSGVTIRSVGSNLDISAQYGRADLYKRGTDEWVVAGDLS